MGFRPTPWGAALAEAGSSCTTPCWISSETMLVMVGGVSASRSAISARDSGA